MKRLMSLVLGFCFVLGCAEAQSADLVVGEAAPDFTLIDTIEGKHSLSEFNGKYVVLEWINHDCPFVRKHYDSGNMQALQKAYTQKGVVWLSICSSAHGKQGHYHSEEFNRLTIAKDAAPTAVLLDIEGTVGRRYGAKTTPHMYIVNPDGILIYKGAIDDHPSTNSDDIPASKNYVSRALDEAMSGKAVSESSTQSYGCSVKY